MNEARNIGELEKALELCKRYLDKEYLEELTSLDLVDIPMDDNNIRIIKLKKFVYNEKENNIEKLTSVLTSINNINSTFAYIINSTKNEVNIYLAIKTLDKTSLGKDLLENGLKGNFPGIELENIYRDEVDLLFDKKIFNKSMTSIASSVVIPKEKNEKLDIDIQGIEKFIDSMLGEEYTAIFLAKSLTFGQITQTKEELEKIYTLISPFKETDFSFSENEGTNLSKTISEGITKGISNTITHTQGTSNTTTKTIGGSIGGGLGSSITGSIGILGLGASIGKTISLNASINGSIAKGKTESSSDSKSNTTQESTNRTNSDTKGYTKGESRTYSFKSENKSRVQLLEKIDATLTRIQESEDIGMFSFGAYFIAHTSDIALRLASTYTGLVRGKNSGLENNHINVWSDERCKVIENRLRNLENVVLKDETDLEITPTTLITCRELSIGTGFPYKSVPGINSMNFTPFARNVCTYDNITYGSKVRLGNVFHMGNEENRSIDLSVQDLTMHTFITGSTGSGKTNTTCKLIEEVNKKGVKVLVIEPAKGEYKYALDANKFNVYGTNPYMNNMLKINPFSFPKNILVLEHIDRLVEIFSACWPLYAAMPAILKEAIVTSYESVGWDLDDSYNESGEFPTFITLLSILPEIINKSAYSDELKSNYIGSLVTRVKSLTVGILGNILNNGDIKDEELFENNNIIDLSRMGSVENKSLIMGMLFLKLYQYKIDKEEFTNELKHLTVIEEAHNLLRKTSTSSSEGNNIQQKSVEMISNGIAEMRAYGEGFVIVDQSPTSLDDSVIKNTNTKILLRLPDERDRKLVGESALLKDDQKFEIARLRRGVAVVFQNNWLEPVLCKIDRFDSKNNYKSIRRTPNDFKVAKRKIIEIILAKKTGEEISVSKQEQDRIFDYLNVYSIDNNFKEKFTRYIEANPKDKMLVNFEDSAKVAEFIYKTLNGEKIISDAINRCSNKSDELIEDIHKILVEELNQKLEFNFINTVEIIKHILIYNAMVGGNLERNFLNNWIHLMEGRNLF
ncbi:helicase HerA domain-containing protein [Romboutsia sp.]|uniref:ATP-binding protein n=1 Tax=Romboutsia sp. TaxID=1965302 RepID=UPI003F2EFF7F